MRVLCDSYNFFETLELLVCSDWQVLVEVVVEVEVEDSEVAVEDSEVGEEEGEGVEVASRVLEGGVEEEDEEGVA